RRPQISRKLPADLVHNDFGIGLAGQVMVVVGQQLVSQLGIVGKLAVERKAKPLPPLQVMPLERLGVIAIFTSTRRISHVTDGSPSCIAIHQAFRLAAVAQTEYLANAP